MRLNGIGSYALSKQARQASAARARNRKRNKGQFADENQPPPTPSFVPRRPVTPSVATKTYFATQVPKHLMSEKLQAAYEISAQTLFLTGRNPRYETGTGAKALGILGVGFATIAGYGATMGAAFPGISNPLGQMAQRLFNNPHALTGPFLGLGLLLVAFRGVAVWQARKAHLAHVDRVVRNQKEFRSKADSELNAAWRVKPVERVSETHTAYRRFLAEAPDEHRAEPGAVVRAKVTFEEV